MSDLVSSQRGFPCLCALSPAQNGFIRFTSKVTPTDLLAASKAAELFWSTYLPITLVGFEPGLSVPLPHSLWQDRRSTESAMPARQRIESWPILFRGVCVSIDTMLNFDVDVGVNFVATCEQIFRREQHLSIEFTQWVLTVHPLHIAHIHAHTHTLLTVVTLGTYTSCCTHTHTHYILKTFSYNWRQEILTCDVT